MLALAALLAACQSLADVQPGRGRTATITGQSYDDIWAAALRVVGEHFEIAEQDKARGVIRAERTTHWRGPFLEYGNWVGIYITPPAAGAERYTVEVVNKKKLRTSKVEQRWNRKVLRDLQDVLAGRPMR